MKIALPLTLFAVLTIAHAEPAKPGLPPLRDAVEVSPRNGLPNFFAKLEAGKDVRIGYLGGSITAQNGWRVQSLKAFQKQFPKAKLKEINAAIGGTGSELGVLRMDADVLDGMPDLLFVEFAVNDAQATPAGILRSMEGIVRKTWRLLPETDICFVYTLTARDIDSYKNRKFSQSATAMETVADRYGIPSVSFGVEVARLEKAGELVMASEAAHVERVSGDELNEAFKQVSGPIAFSKDGVHPYLDTGHVLYTQALMRSMDVIRRQGEPGPHTPGEPLGANTLEFSKKVNLRNEGAMIFSGDAIRLDPTTSPLAKQFATRLPSLWKLTPGATLNFTFKGTKAALYGLLAPDSGILEITVDGRTRKQPLFDPHTTYPRLSMFFVAEGLEDKEHKVTVTVLSEIPDKAAILPETKRKEIREHPEKYKGLNAYLGAIFVVGEIPEGA